MHLRPSHSPQKTSVSKCLKTFESSSRISLWKTKKWPKTIYLNHLRDSEGSDTGRRKSKYDNESEADANDNKTDTAKSFSRWHEKLKRLVERAREMEIGKRTRDTWNNDDTDHGQGTRQNMTEQDSRNNKSRPNILSSQQRMCQTKTNVQTLESPTRKKST